MAYKVGLVEKDCLTYHSDESKASWTHSALSAFQYLRMSGCCTQVLSRIAIGGDGVVYRASNRDGEDVAAKLYLSPSGYHLLLRFDFNPSDIATQDRYELRTRPFAEYDSLIRMSRAGVRCPAPIKLTGHVLVMEFLGKDGVPAPTLSVARLYLDQLRECYKEAVKIMRTLYQKCGLVHGHLNETNMLYHEGHLYVIDGSQCIRTHHDYASEVLKKDCARVLGFFSRRSIDVMTVKELFDFVRDPSLTDDDSVDITTSAASSSSGVSGAETDPYSSVVPTGYELNWHKAYA